MRTVTVAEERNDKEESVTVKFKGHARLLQAATLDVQLGPAFHRAMLR